MFLYRIENRIRKCVPVCCIGLCVCCLWTQLCEPLQVGFSRAIRHTDTGTVFSLPESAGYSPLTGNAERPDRDEPLVFSAAGMELSAQDVPIPTLQEDFVPSGTGEQLAVAELAISGGKKVENFTVTDNTGTGLDLAEELQNAPAFSLAKNGEPTVLIYHTHTTESYFPGESTYTYADTSSRSLQESENVVAVGEAIAAVLRQAGIGVVHDTTVHDSPAYNGAYDRSYETIRKNLEQYPSICVTLDVHRDCMIAEDGTHYKPTVTVNGQKAAQVMVITGCDPYGEFGFPDWQENLHFALRVQQKGAALYGNFLRPLNFCERRYNMEATCASLLLEVGTEVNTVPEAVYAGKLMGDVLAQVLLENG